MKVFLILLWGHGGFLSILQSDIRKWFMKSHDKNKATEPKPTNQVKPSPAKPQAEKPVSFVVVVVVVFYAIRLLLNEFI